MFQEVYRCMYSGSFLSKFSPVFLTLWGHMCKWSQYQLKILRRFLAARNILKSIWNCSKRPAMVLNTWKKFFQEKQHRRGFYINSPFFKEGTPVSLKKTFEGMGNLSYNTIISIYNKVGTGSCLVDADETYVTKGFFNIQMSLIKISHCLRMPYRIFI